MRMLAVDLGARRVGFAVCDAEETIASPAGVAAVADGAGALAAIVDKCREVEAVRIVLGHPRDMSGRHGPKAREAEELAKRLEGEGFDVDLFDERLTTVEAERALRAGGRTRKQRRGAIDAVAAQRLLHAYLEARRRELG